MKTHQTILKACTIMSVALLSLVSTQKAMSQSLWGMTSGGGTYGNGEIFTVPSGDTGVTLEYSMTGIAGADPQYTALIKATDGLYYGMTAEGGINNDGVIFSYDSATKAYTELFEFNGQNGANPYGSLLQDTNGIMYGMTENGGLYGYGVVFSFNPATKAYTLLQSVASQSYPTGSFIQAASGNLYAVMPWGGMGTYYGFIFLWDIKTNGMGIISDFQQYNGQYPYGSLIQATDGNFYGLTEVGGYYSQGVIFMYNPTRSPANLEDLYDFTTPSGEMPYGSLIQSGKMLYGMTEAGGAYSYGTIFSFDTAAKLHNVIYSFNLSTGANPYGSLLQISNGKMFGTAEGGGANSDGVIFSFDTTKKTYKDIYDFNGTNGKNPHGTLLQTTGSSFYGMASAGGLTNSGVMFKVDTSGNYKKLIDFNTCAEGSDPQGSLLYASDSLFYGMTHSGGKYNYGTIFSYNPFSRAYTDLVDFNDSNGANPYGSLIQAKNGLLYGMTYAGGTNSVGVIFSYNITSKAYTVMHNFIDSTGRNPHGSLLQGFNGKLYGMTLVGGKGKSGVLFSIDMAGNYAHLHDFAAVLNGEDGANPYGSLVQMPNGLMYGLTSSYGGQGYGDIFVFDTVSHNCQDICDMQAPYGTPYGSFTIYNDTTLYATALSYGNTYYDGVIFAFYPNRGILNIVHAFDITDGYNPHNDLVLSSDGNLYGMTVQGGLYGYGVLYQIAPVTNTYTKLEDFWGNNGGTPYGNLIETPSYVSGVKNISSPELHVTVFPNPASGLLNIRLNKTINNTSVITVIDVAGRDVMSETRNIRSTNLQLDIHSLPAGLYFVNISTPNGNEVAKFVKE